VRHFSSPLPARSTFRSVQWLQEGSSEVIFDQIFSVSGRAGEEAAVACFVQ
jgi:hypothetical protein